MALSKLRLGQLKPADGSTTVGDVHFPKVKLLLPFDGSNGATSTSDSSNSTQSVTFNNSAEISTTQSKFGGSSLSCPDGLTSDVSTSWSAMPTGTEDFTIELWAYFIDRTGGGRSETDFGIWGNRNTSGTDNIHLYVGYPDDNMLGFLINDTDVQLTTTWNVTSNLNAWHHIALTRASNTFRLFVDGTQVGTVTSTATMTRSYSDLFIGSSGHTWNATRAVRGFIDGFRITRSIARYTSAFTAPSSAHLTSAGDVNKQIIVNSSADGVAIGTGGISQARIAKAWAEFDGSGLTLNASYNVSSVTDHGNRDYTINFGTAMADTNYSIVGSNIGQTASYNWSVVTGMGTAKTTSAARINVPHINDSSLYGNDPDAVNVIAFGN